MQGIPSLVTSVVSAANTATAAGIDLTNTKGVVAIAIHSASGTWAAATPITITDETGNIFVSTTAGLTRVRIFVFGDSEGCPLDIRMLDGAQPTLQIPTLPGGIGAARPKGLGVTVGAGGVGVIVTIIIVAESASL